MHTEHYNQNATVCEIDSSWKLQKELESRPWLTAGQVLHVSTQDKQKMKTWHVQDWRRWT